MLDVFLDYLETQGYSSNTLRSYRNNLTMFKDIDLGQVKLKDLEVLLSDNLNTAATQQAAFKAFFGWLYEQGYIKINPAEGLKVPRPKNDPVAITYDDYKAIMDTINKLPLTPKTFFLLLNDTALTPNQILSLSIEEALSYPDAHELISVQKKDPLFTNAQNKKASYNWAYYWWQQVLKSSGVQHRYAMYQLKHSDYKTP